MNKSSLEKITMTIKCEDNILQKHELRKQVKKQVSQLSEEELTEKSIKICKKILNWPHYEESINIFFYMPLKSEPNIFEIIEKSKLLDKNCFIPKVNNNGTMDFYKIINEEKLENQVELGSYNILEPKNNLKKFELINKTDIDIFSNKTLFLIPGIAFDNKKNRIGKGMGFYDKYLSKIIIDKKNVFFVGISFDFLIFNNIPVEKNDIKMDYIISDTKIY